MLALLQAAVRQPSAPNMVKVILANTGNAPFTIKRGDRIAQLVIQRIEEAAFSACTELPSTSRGEGGFGSSGR